MASIVFSKASSVHMPLLVVEGKFNFDIDFLLCGSKTSSETWNLTQTHKK
jgi:hypothetical protein